MFDLSGKAALVTGASGGIGGAIASALHAAGASVVLSGTRRLALDELAARLGERTAIETADLADPGVGDTLVAAAERHFGKLDILVSNAGLTRDNLALRMKDDDWQQVLDVNLGAAFRLSRAALKGMMRRRWGRIVAIGSVVGATGNPGQANYVAAKAGLAGLMKALAGEIASRGVTCNTVAPGFIETQMTAALAEDQRRRLAERIPAGRFGAPADVAAAVVFLASEEAGYVTGQTLHVNGGMAMI